MSTEITQTQLSKLFEAEALKHPGYWVLVLWHLHHAPLKDLRITQQQQIAQGNHLFYRFSKGCESSTLTPPEAENINIAIGACSLSRRLPMPPHVLHALRYVFFEGLNKSSDSLADVYADSYQRFKSDERSYKIGAKNAASFIASGQRYTLSDAVGAYGFNWIVMEDRALLGLLPDGPYKTKIQTTLRQVDEEQSRPLN